MKILILANSDAGLYRFRKELIQRLIELDNNIYIALPKGEYINRLKKFGCKFIETHVDRRGINPIKDYFLFSKYLKIIRKTQPDLVISYTIKPNIYGSIASFFCDIPYAVNITGLGTAFQNRGIVRFIVINLYKFALKKAKVVFFENSSDRDTFYRFKICSKDKMYVLHGAGVNTEEYSYCEYPDNNVFRFLFVGRVMKEKGVNELLSAMKKLIKSENAILDIVGLCEENYNDILDKYEKEGWLNYYGYQDDVRKFIEKCDCFVLPSWHEGMANTNLECASSGRPIITSNIPGCKEAVNDESGLLCEPKNVESLYRCMMKIVKLDREEREMMGRKGRKHIELVFDKNKVVKDTINRLEKGFKCKF